ncbi:MAG: hypothetical protein PCFJNLEI_02834 [Verrucomicrobiae bacterium]|nr:hypothetical protein [Verrucomicrobiae bacterium]
MKDGRKEHDSSEFKPLPLRIPQSITDPIQTYETAIDLARLDDTLGWRMLEKRARASATSALISWREEASKTPPLQWDQVPQRIDEAFERLAPRIALALVGVESRKPVFSNQRAVFDELTNIGKWERSGVVSLVELPNTFGYIYQGLHGALCLDTEQLDLALALADLKTSNSYSEGTESLWQIHELIGWPQALGGNCTHAWKYLSARAKQWTWLSEIFGGEQQYRVGLSAYYMALSVHELAAFVAGGNGETLKSEQQNVRMDVPLSFFEEGEEINRRAVALLLRNDVERLWVPFGLKRDDIRRYWPHWTRWCLSWINGVYHYPYVRTFPFGKLFA